jgi:hypothetical protein
VHGTCFGQTPALVRVTLDGLPLLVISVRDDAIVVRAPLEAMAGSLGVRVALQGSALYPRAIRVVSGAEHAQSKPVP